MTLDTAQRISWDQISYGENHHWRGVLLWENRDDLSDEDYWPAVAETWQDSDRQPLTKSEWQELWFTPTRQHNRNTVMTPDELAKLDALPDRVTVHRGYRYRIMKANRATGTWYDGLSWTTDRLKAEFFARCGGPEYWGLIVTGTVLRKRIIAVFDDRNESEIVVEPRYVYKRSSTIVVAPTSLQESDQAPAA